MSHSLSSTRSPTVFIVDDDPSVRHSLKWLVESAGLESQTFPSAVHFLESFDEDQPGCLVLDIRMPEMTGMELQERLYLSLARLPIIIVTGHGDVPLCAQAMKSGAFDFFEKPVNDMRLLQCIEKAIELDDRHRRLINDYPVVTQRMKKLTLREREVLMRICSGKQMKQVVKELGITQQSVARHRSRILEKMCVENDVELVRLIQPLESLLSVQWSNDD